MIFQLYYRLLMVPSLFPTISRLCNRNSCLIQASQSYLNEKANQKDLKVSITEHREYQVGNYILLSYPSRPPSKLAGLYRGPLIVHRKLHADIYEVMDLISNKMYQVHISRMHALNLPPNIDRQEILRIAGIDHSELVVEAIIDHRGNPRKKLEMEFRIRWKGYEPADDTWEPFATVKDLAALDEYSAAHPDLHLG